MVVNIIQDELMLEVPDAMVEEAKEEVQRSTIAAGAYMLSKYNIPVQE